MADINDVLQVARVFKSQAEADLMKDTYSKVLPTNMISFCDAVIELLKEQKGLLEKKQHDIDKMCLENSRLKHLINDKQPRKVNNIRALTNVSKCGECPSCGGRVYTTANEKFCGHCGDRIDWKDGEQE